MTSDILAQAQADEADTERRIAELEREAAAVVERLTHEQGHLREISAFVKMYAKYAGRPIPGEKPLVPTDLGRLSIADAAEEVIRSMGGEARVMDVLPVLVKAGKLPGKPESRYGIFVGALKRHPDRFQKSRPGTWRIKESVTSEGGIEPSALGGRAIDDDAGDGLAGSEPASPSGSNTHDGSASHGLGSALAS